jgi:kynurenine 3-monooxygenase
MKEKTKDIAIVGAGLVGSLLGIYLAKKGHNVTIFERRPDLRKADISAGKSINLAMSERGWKALDAVGVGDEIRKMAIPMFGRMIHHPDGKQVFQPYGIHNQAINSVSRGGLNAILMDFAEKSGAQIQFNQGCESVDTKSNTIYFSNGNTREAEIIFGADGAFSKVRGSMMKKDRFNYSQYYIPHGYKELNIPPENGGWKIEKNALHIWPRGNFMLIALPNKDGSFTCTLFAPFEGEHSFEAVKDKKDLFDFFNSQFPDVVPLMPTLETDYFTNPTSSLVTIRCFPWTIDDRMALIGDAAHGIVPFYGQGMISGFEDCTVLHELMESHGDNWGKIFMDYESSRKPNTDAIAELAFHNFVVMRDKVADPVFLYRKKLERMMNEAFPEDYVPLYTQVSFSHFPYADALIAGKKQDRFFEEILPGMDITQKPDTATIEKLVKGWKAFEQNS